jgi:hypothetical protein
MNSAEKIRFDGESGVFADSVRKACTFLDYAHPAPLHADMDALYALEGFGAYREDAEKGWIGRLQTALFRRLFWRQMLVNEALAARIRQVQGNPDSGKPHLLFITPHDAVQPLMGGAARNHEVARFLSRWFRVHLIAITKPSKESAVIPMGPDFEILSFPLSKKQWAQVDDYHPRYDAAGWPVMLMESGADTPNLLAYLRTMVPKTALAIFSGPYLYPALREVLGDVPLVYETMDVTADFVRMIAKDKDAEGAAQLTEKVERELIQKAQLVVGVTPRDIQIMQERFGAPKDKFLLVPNGVNVGQRFCSVPSLSRELRRSSGITRPMVLFVGSSLMANMEAVAYIKNSLAPALPGALFVVMGVRKCDFRQLPEGQGAFPENVIFTGPLPDNSRLKEAVFLLAEVAIAPMIHGTGSSLKVPDYLAHGKLLVATELGARGHEALHPYIRLAERADFRDALGHMLAKLEADATFFDSQAEAAQAKVLATLDWPVTCTPWAAALQRIGRKIENKETRI